jgi:dTDP-glucose 4,6-dehydratase
MRVFVTGGAGFIGSNFIRYILSRHQVEAIVNYDKLTYAGNVANLQDVVDDPRYSFTRGDICDPGGVEAAMATCDAVVHFAAESHVDRSIFAPAPTIETNVTGTFTLLRIARALGVKRFVHISTDEVYGDLQPGTTAHEESPLRPNSPYAASKASADQLVRSFVHTYGFPAVVVRSSNNYGPHQFPEKFIPLVICNALEENQVPVYGDGLQERDWLHVEDCCAGIAAILQGGRVGEIYNLGGSNVEKNIDVVRGLLRIMDKPQSLIQFVADRPGHDRRYAVNCAKAIAELGWRPAIDFDQGLKGTVAWYRTHPEWVASVRSGEYLSYYEQHYSNRKAHLEALGIATNR